MQELSTCAQSVADLFEAHNSEVATEWNEVTGFPEMLTNADLQWLQGLEGETRRTKMRTMILECADAIESFHHKCTSERSDMKRELKRDVDKLRKRATKLLEHYTPSRGMRLLLPGDIVPPHTHCRRYLGVWLDLANRPCYNFKADIYDMWDMWNMKEWRRYRPNGFYGVLECESACTVDWTEVNGFMDGVRSMDWTFEWHSSLAEQLSIRKFVPGKNIGVSFGCTEEKMPFMQEAAAVVHHTVDTITEEKIIPGNVVPATDHRPPVSTFQEECDNEFITEQMNKWLHPSVSDHFLVRGASMYHLYFAMEC